MVILSFPNWSDALDAADLSAADRKRHRVIINWFLGHLKREHQGVSVESAREFIQGLIESRRPQEWQVEQWREGINWFFRAAPVRKRLPDKRSRQAKAAAAAGTVGSASNDGETTRQTMDQATKTVDAAEQDAVVRDADEAEFDDGRRQYAHTIAELQDRVPVDPWYDEMTRVMRVRHMAYRTEQTYLLENGTNIRTVQEILGHTCVENTMIQRTP